MVFKTPDLSQDESDVLALIDQLRVELRDKVAEPRRWSGNLRRMSFARAVQASNSIEGYNASLDDVAAVVGDEPTLEASEETKLAVAGYRDAMTYVLQIAQDANVVIDEGLLKSLHFMMIKHDLAKNPGRWRPGTVFVRDESTGEVVYEGPPRDEVPSLISAMLADQGDKGANALITAAMAHLNLVMIHPFSDGNGRMARCLQTLVLARDRIVAPVFSSIEEFLGRNTSAYYDVLAEVGAGGWHPQRSARPWVRFCLRAHYLQAQTVLRRHAETIEQWNACAEIADTRRLPERAAAALMDAAYGLRIRRGGYIDLVNDVTGEEISELTASRDLRAAVEADLLEPVGERRGRYYVAAEPIRRIREQARATRPPRAEDDPFELVRAARQSSLL